MVQNEFVSLGSSSEFFKGRKKCKVSFFRQSLLHIVSNSWNLRVVFSHFMESWNFTIVKWHALIHLSLSYSLVHSLLCHAQIFRKTKIRVHQSWVTLILFSFSNVCMQCVSCCASTNDANSSSVNCLSKWYLD